jgi:hypothetical protein
MINPGFPALLTPLALLAKENWGIYQAFSALILAAAPWLLWLWVRRRLDRPKSLLVCALFALSPLVLCQAGTVMSEAPCLLFTIGLLIALEAPPSATSAGAWLLAATQIRTAAMACLPGVLARPVSKRNWGSAALIAAPSLIGAALWSAWSRSRTGAAQQKIEELAVSYAGNIGRVPAVAWDNAKYYLASWGASYLPPRWARGPAAAALGAILLAVAFQGAVRIWRRDRCQPALWALGGTILLHALWPWQYERYLIMPLPFLLWCLCEGLGRSAVTVLALLLAGQAAFQSRVWINGDHDWTRPELSRTYDWLRSNTRAEDIVASTMYVRDGFYAGRPALPVPAGSDAASFYGVLHSHRVHYVLWQEGLDLGLSLDASSVVRGQLDRDAAALEDRTRFKPVYSDPEEHARIYELL